MEDQQDEKLSQLVEDLTTSGQQVLDPEKMRQLKKICKSSEEYVKHAYHLIMRQLNQEHAEIRLSAFQIANELFVRSNQFRLLLVSNFQEFLELTVETNFEQPLPPPKETAQKLKKMAIKSVQEWQDKYGNAYKKLSLGYHFLKQIKKVDFQGIRARTQAERRREEERLKRLENINNVRVKRAEEEMKDMSEEIQNTLTELEECFKLLLPNLSEFTLHDIGSQSKQLPDRTDNGSSATSRQRDDHQSYHCDDEQPCSSKDLAPLPHMNSLPEEQESDEELDDFSQNEEGESEQLEDNEESFIRNHGLLSHKYSLDLEIHTDLKIKEDEENSAVINNIKDFQRLITNKYLPTVQYWIQAFTKAGINDDRLRRAIDLKNAIGGVLKKHDEMNISYKERQRKVMKATDEDDDDDDDFVEVPEKEGYEPHIQEHLQEEYGLEPLIQKTKEAVKNVTPSAGPPALRRSDEELDPTCAAATLKIWKQQLSSRMYSLPGTSEDNVRASTSAGPELSSEDAKKRKREEEMKIAPVMPFGLDLHYWGEQQTTTGKILKVDTPHRFLESKDVEGEHENEEMTALLKTRYITFAGKFEPVTHKCRAPLPNGRLCERQDRFKCPFHGKIISRDEQGNPVNPEDIQRLEQEEQRKQKEKADWRDPELMREIEAATGANLGSSRCNQKGKGKKGKKKKYPNLTDLKQENNTARSRLEKRVFNNASLKRVSKAMASLDKRKHEKFANQFNYALN
ncbi:UV-stimulated scaffold protein A [Pristis pectinata]|uniref:UV-stimulated scaffold protein A n=1 Tax=Pristis pectinata TaxID=685728 RepID=UPI00223CC289|nr:UV-stimulated scaffold protein A [Pristis pectinata]XP_051865205.1 UV-stimulated scaffold protein A [Pristis pectinata]XP_051865215.1 UV-stimulated scaffold protein A [Pristis pectinata]